ncbi:hypothetical protein [Amycolatopsis sp.]|nr:hypothetical protein [Amycolatopsis sp.]HET6708122.1 hypothetical protein [Amycolatopsis sp.]
MNTGQPRSPTGRYQRATRSNDKLAVRYETTVHIAAINDWL